VTSRPRASFTALCFLPSDPETQRVGDWWGSRPAHAGHAVLEKPLYSSEQQRSGESERFYGLRPMLMPTPSKRRRDPGLPPKQLSLLLTVPIRPLGVASLVSPVPCSP
jgi:hypothetical protein